MLHVRIHSNKSNTVLVITSNDEMEDSESKLSKQKYLLQQCLQIRWCFLTLVALELVAMLHVTCSWRLGATIMLHATGSINMTYTWTGTVPLSIGYHNLTIEYQQGTYGAGLVVQAGLTSVPSSLQVCCSQASCKQT